jgi:hypothetical protein
MDSLIIRSVTTGRYRVTIKVCKERERNMYREKIVKEMLAAIGIILLAIASSFGAQKGKPAPPPPYVSASVQFIDRNDDNIKSDGLNDRTYTDGSRGISCYMYTTTNPGTGIVGDVILNITAAAKRKLWYNFSPIDGSGPSGVICSNTEYINIRGVYPVIFGHPQASSAQIGSGFLFLGAYAISDHNPGQYSTPVLIERLNDKQWQVTADPEVGSEYWIDPYVTTGTYNPADIAQRISDGIWYSYHVPFQVIITIK